MDAFHTHTYICHSHPPDLEWATHEVKRMARIEVALNPFGKIGLRGYSKALQKYHMRLQQRPAKSRINGTRARSLAGVEQVREMHLDYCNIEIAAGSPAAGSTCLSASLKRKLKPKSPPVSLTSKSMSHARRFGVACLDG